MPPRPAPSVSSVRRAVGRAIRTLRALPLLCALVCAFAPAGLRLLDEGRHLAGLCSDLALGVIFLLIVWISPWPLRALLALLWAVFQTGSQELLLSLQRLPVWQDAHYLTDADFVKNTTEGLHFGHPLFAFVQLGSALLVPFAPRKRPFRRMLAGGALAAGLLLVGQHQAARYLDSESVSARYNPLHWFLVDTAANNPWTEPDESTIRIPDTLARADLRGKPLIQGSGRAKNLLIVVLEGIPGLYIPEIREAMGVAADRAPVTMTRLDEATRQAMLIPDFSVHSHQTIRGLYALLCGDFSKFSWDTPKAFELEEAPERAGACLPAQLRMRGWSTHYLQGAGLGFMSKDRVMAQVGFDEAHGEEWFKKEKNPFPFEWGKTDCAFFQGARRYIRELRGRRGADGNSQPWMLTLLTVGTHQPYAAPDEIADRYPSRKDAAVALLDEAVGLFLNQLAADGVLEDTLVIVTSDESHGAEDAPWASAWGLGLVLAPERADLPRLKQGGYGLVDLAASSLDYFGLPLAPGLRGRSFFRDYDRPRDMLAFTASTLRRHTPDNQRIECAADGLCRGGTAASILGDPPENMRLLPRRTAKELAALARALDHDLVTGADERVLHFGSGEIRRAPDPPGNDWSDNLIGAQSLNFPENSDVELRLRLTLMDAAADSVHIRLLAKEWEKDQPEAHIPALPALKKGESLEQTFGFHNTAGRQSFSFHLLADSPGAQVRIDRFDVIIRRTEKGTTQQAKK